jgi:micrococcal nuclease
MRSRTRLSLFGFAFLTLIFIATHVPGSVLLAPVERASVVQAVATSSRSAAAPLSSQPFYPVVRVIDGDTVVVRVDGVDEKVRLIGINTPETVDPRTPVQCFGQQASAEAKRMLEGQSVRLEMDASQGKRDKYGRLLAYVFLADGTNVNEHMVTNGFAYEYTYRAPYRYQAQFTEAQRAAQEAQEGLWSPQTCNGTLQP